MKSTSHKSTSAFVAAVVAGGLLGGPLLGATLLGATLLGATAAQAACMPGDHVDNTTAQQTVARIKKAGYGKVTDLQKGCDSFWHGVAEKDGKRVPIVVTPQGQVMRDGD